MRILRVAVAILVGGLVLAGTAVAKRPVPTTQHTCDRLDPSVCLMPWPNDYFTVHDSSTATGLRVNLFRESTPANAAGVHIDPSEFNLSDGFSPGDPIVTKVPGLDTQQALANTGAPTINSLDRSFARNQSIVVIDARTLQRQLIWAEVDANASSPANAALEIHPATDLLEGHRYIVALRHLRDANNRLIPPRAEFRMLRDERPTNSPFITERRDHFRSLFQLLARAGIRRSDLYLAWDFTVASSRNLTERALAIRDDAFSQLGDTNLGNGIVEGGVPPFTITTVTNFAPCGNDGCQAGEDDRLVRRVVGRITVPCYLNQMGCPPGARFVHEPASNPLPTRIPGNTMQANFVCNIPRTAAGDGTAVVPARPLLYGHGLFGSATEVNSNAQVSLAFEHNFLMCATDWVGMAAADRGNAAAVLQDLSAFASLPDRLQQSYVNFFYLGRLLDNPAGFNSDPAFQLPNGGGTAGAIDTSHLFYDGGSQGGIEGAALTALSPDWTRAALGVPGMNYSILLPRSVDFDPFATIMNASYRNELERPLILSMLQLLWDRGDPQGYVQHLTRNPLPGTPVHQVILDEAFGDHQVANIATEVEARTIGAQLRSPILDPGRSTAHIPYFGIPRIAGFPFQGSMIEVWDVGPLRDIGGGVIKGTPPPPITNTANRLGVDPHGPDASETVIGRAQVSAFLQPDAQSQIIDVCGLTPCYLDGYTGPTP